MNKDEFYREQHGLKVTEQRETAIITRNEKFREATKTNDGRTRDNEKRAPNEVVVFERTEYSWVFALELRDIRRHDEL